MWIQGEEAQEMTKIKIYLILSYSITKCKGMFLNEKSSSCNSIKFSPKDNTPSVSWKEKESNLG